jgi:hypothetical protein
MSEIELTKKRFRFEYTINYKCNKYIISILKVWDNLYYTIRSTIIFANEDGTEIVENDSDLGREILIEFSREGFGIDT